MLDLNALGTMIREARVDRGWRAIDLAVEMGWAGTAPVYRIERPGPATPRPTPQTINQLATVLDLDYADRMTLLGFAGHVPDTEELTPREEAQLIDHVRPIMDAAKEPMVLYDFRERILALNDAVLKPYGFRRDVVRSWRAAGLTAFDLLWSPSHGFHAGFINTEAVHRSQMLRFKLDNRLRRHEAWYRAYPGCYAHFPGFVELWQETEAMLHGPASEWRLSGLIPRTNEVHGPLGPALQFDASRRMVHLGHGLASLGIYGPGNDETRDWLSTEN